MGITQGYQLDLSLQLRLFRCVFDNVILEHGEIPCVLPLAVHLDLGHLPDNQGYLRLLSEPCTSQKILVTAHRPDSPFPLLDLTFRDFGHGFWAWILGLSIPYQIFTLLRKVFLNGSLMILEDLDEPLTQREHLVCELFQELFQYPYDSDLKFSLIFLGD